VTVPGQFETVWATGGQALTIRQAKTLVDLLATAHSKAAIGKAAPAKPQVVLKTRPTPTLPSMRPDAYFIWILMVVVWPAVTLTFST
jgi:hypothetical protein